MACTCSVYLHGGHIKIRLYVSATSVKAERKVEDHDAYLVCKTDRFQTSETSSTQGGVAATATAAAAYKCRGGDGGGLRPHRYYYVGYTVGATIRAVFIFVTSLINFVSTSREWQRRRRRQVSRVRVLCGALLVLFASVPRPSGACLVRLCVCPTTIVVITAARKNLISAYVRVFGVSKRSCRVVGILQAVCPRLDSDTHRPPPCYDESINNNTLPFNDPASGAAATRCVPCRVVTGDDDVTGPGDGGPYTRQGRARPNGIHRRQQRRGPGPTGVRGSGGPAGGRDPDAGGDASVRDQQAQVRPRVRRVAVRGVRAGPQVRRERPGQRRRCRRRGARRQPGGRRLEEAAGRAGRGQPGHTGRV